MISKSPLSEATSLSSEILADMELGRIPNHQILVKCRRLARLVGDANWMKWLDLEIHGYNFNFTGIPYEERQSFFTFFGRELNSEKHTGLVHPLATLEQEIETAKLEIAACRVPTSIQASNVESLLPDSASSAIQHILFRLKELRTIITQRQVIISRVMGLAYNHTLKWYNELHYGDIAQTIFERRRSEVDAKLKDLCPQALEQFVSAYHRLRSENKEDWSQALFSCRRVLKSFANSVFPPNNQPYIDKWGKEHDVSEDKYINRILSFIDKNTPSETFAHVLKSQLEYLGNRLSAIHDETHKGVHAETTRREADSTVILTYILLSDLVDLLPHSIERLEGVG